MRKIERDMLEHITKRKDFKRANTEVRFTGKGNKGGHLADILLWDRVLAYLMRDGTIRPNLSTVRDWPTMTTRSRLNALGIDAWQRDHIFYVEGEAITEVPR